VARHSQARKIVHSMKRILERSDDYHQIFPHIVRDTPWTDTSLTVRRRT
jgi:SRSO17 transposase